MSIAIRVEGLSKKYKYEKNRISSLKDFLSSPFKNSSPAEEFWALEDISFEVKKGERLGIIGANGAGKSTLLKILSGISKPTRGRAEINGRLSSLLELGTGFHPELTGRENIFLNGSILGMDTREIQSKFDEIVDFSSLEKFIDEPVKHYSSGMILRLGFSVSAHLKSEILVIDEVLAVGDFYFQKKCFGKMDELEAEGRTLILVSHQLSLTAQICNRALLLEKGRLLKEGTPETIIQAYIQKGASKKDANYSPKNKNHSYLQKAELLNEKDEPTTEILHDETLFLKMEWARLSSLKNTVMGFFLRDRWGRKVFTSNNPHWMEAPHFKTEAIIPARFLAPGDYTFSLTVSDSGGVPMESHEDALQICIRDGGTEFAKYEGQDYGCVLSPCEWRRD